MSGLHQREWDRLLSALNTWATAAELESGRIRVRFVDSTGSHRQVEIVMTSEDWDDWIGMLGSSPEAAAGEVKKALLRIDGAHGFLVYELYELQPSATEQLPPNEVLEWLRTHPVSGGRWVVLNDDGTVRDEFH